MAHPVAAGAVTRPEDTAAPSPRSGDGPIPGIAGGLALLIVVSLVAGLAGHGWLQPLRALGGAVVGHDAGWAAVGAGLLLLAAGSAAFGLLFARLLPGGFPVTSSIAVGAGYGFLVAGLVMSLLVPDAMRERMQPLGGAWVIGYAVYGMTLAALLVRRRAP